MKGGGLQSGTDVSAHEGEGPGGIECGCCCSDSVRIEEMVQCADGHLFCFTCLRRRVEESTYGGAQAGTYLLCMDTSGCGEFFPWSEVKRALPPDVLARYEQRQAQDAVLQAKIPGLVYCPFCETPYEISPNLRVLECENGSCKKVGALRNTVILPLAKGYLKLWHSVLNAGSRVTSLYNVRRLRRGRRQH